MNDLKMKKLILISLICTNLQATTIIDYMRDSYLKKNIAPLTLIFMSGACDGYSEVLDHHRADFLSVHPNASDWWNNDWTSKYKNNDPLQGEKFPLSTTSLVFVVDGYHATRSARNVFMVAAIVIKVGEKKPFKLYVVDAIIYSLTYSLGFTCVYDWIY